MTVVEKSAEIGKRLMTAKRLLSHGRWLPWLREREMSERAAQRYMQIARKFNELGNANPTQRVAFANMSFRGALAAIQEPRDPSPPAHPRARGSEPVLPPAAAFERARAHLEGPAADPVHVLHNIVMDARAAGHTYDEVVAAVHYGLTGDKVQATEWRIGYGGLEQDRAEPEPEPAGDWDRLWYLLDELREFDKVSIPFDEIRENMLGWAEAAGDAGWVGQLMERALEKLSEELKITDEESGGPVIAATFDMAEGDSDEGYLVIKRAYDGAIALAKA